MDAAWSRVSLEQPSKVSLPWLFIITPRHNHKASTSLPTPSVSSCEPASGLSQPHLVSVECAYQSYSRGMRSNSRVPWWLRQLGQAYDVSSTSGLTQDYNFLSSGNFNQIQNSSPHVPTLFFSPLSPTFFSDQSVSKHWAWALTMTSIDCYYSSLTGPVGHLGTAQQKDLHSWETAWSEEEGFGVGQTSLWTQLSSQRIWVRSFT